MKYQKPPVTIDLRGKLVVDPAVLNSKGVQKEIEAARKLKTLLAKKGEKHD